MVNKVAKSTKPFYKDKDYSKLESVIKYIVLAVIFYALYNCPIIPNVFAYAAFCCVGYLLVNPVIGYAIFLGVGLVVDFSISFILSIPVSGLLFLVAYLSIKAYKKNVRTLFFTILAVVSYFTNFHSANSSEIFVKILLQALFLFLSIVVILNALKVPLLRRGNYNLTTDETACICLIIIAVFSGINSITIAGASILNIIGIALILIILFSLPLTYSLTFSILLGLSTALTGNYTLVGLYAMYTIVATIFKDTSKYLSAVSIILTEVLLAYYFEFYDSYSYINLIFIVLGCAVFLLIPQRVLDCTVSKINRGEKQLSRIIVNRNRQRLYLRIMEISGVFKEMENVFTKMQKGFMSKNSASQMLAKECIEKICYVCENYKICNKDKSKLLNDICTAIECGIDKGRVTFIDAPDSISKTCTNTQKMLSMVNQYAQSYRQYVAVMEKMDNSRKLIGKQLGGVAEVIGELASDVKGSVSFDLKTEKNICDELLFNNIICAEAVIYTHDDEPNVSLIVERKNADDEKIAEIVSKILKIPMLVHFKEQAENKTQTAIFLKCAPKYDVVFGAAGCPKYPNELSGDTHSLIRISDDKFMIALCDGMGSGQVAENMSSATISLVENFYKAGLGSNIILESVNNLLAVNSDEIFAALDICVCDLNRGIADFIKLGAPCGYIKSFGKTDVIVGNSLPMGILEETAPSVFSCAIENKSIVVLCTDGVIEAFRENGLKELINDFNSINPQELVEHILENALEYNNGKAKDDMTVLALRIFTKI